MSSLRFEWDEAKNLANQRKHGVSFKQASQVFHDHRRVFLPDRIVDGEQRWQTVGLVSAATGGILLLQVAHTVREELENGFWVEVIRIISARKATPRERRSYANENS